MDIFKIVFGIFIPSLLIFVTYGAYDYGVANHLFEHHNPIQMTYDSYLLNKTQHWKNRFHFREEYSYNVQQRQISGTRQNYLEIKRNKQTYLIEYQSQIDVSLIQSVQQVREINDNTLYPGRYFLVQYDRFVQIVYFDLSSSESDQATYEAQICLQLPLTSDSNARYHIDEQGNIWIVTEAMNKLVFIQIYSCKQRKLIHQFRYALQNHHFISQINKIIKKEQGCMLLEVITYSLTRVQLKVCPQNSASFIREISHHTASQLSFQQVTVPEWQAFDGNQQSVYRQEFNKVINYILNIISLGQDKPLLSKQSAKQELINFDIIAVDERNSYLLKLSREKAETSLVNLGKYLINAKTPLFHDNPSYDSLGILDFLNSEQSDQINPQFKHSYISPDTNQTKTALYKAAYRTYPDKVQHLAIGNKVLIFWPQEALQQKDLLFIRTRDGGLVTEGTKFKGTFQKMPLEYEEVYQLVDSKPQQVMPGILQVHAGYVNLLTRLAKNKNGEGFFRIDLVNTLGGKLILSHYIQVKTGFRYVSNMLLNNEWWVLQYNPNQKTSVAHKYQLYVNSSNRSQILNIKRSYGLIGTPQHVDGQDDLATLMDEYSFKNKNGYILLNVYRCVDQYYYFQFTDSSGSDYGVARIHFKNLSNRRVKKSKKYSGAFEKYLLIDQKNMLPQKFSRKPYAVALKDVSIFNNLTSLIGKSRKQAWHSYCDKNSNFRRLQRAGKYYLFPVHFYAQGAYGCKYASDQPYSENIFGFNMRNIISKGKEHLQQRVQLRRQIVYKIMYWLPIYLVFLGVLYLLNSYCSRKNSPSDSKKNN